jgi:hypothetical protein
MQLYVQKNIATTGDKVSRSESLIRLHLREDATILLIRYVFAKSVENVMPNPMVNK